MLLPCCSALLFNLRDFPDSVVPVGSQNLQRLRTDDQSIEGHQRRELHRRELQSELGRESDLDSVARGRSILLAAFEEFECALNQPRGRWRQHRSDFRVTER